MWDLGSSGVITDHYHVATTRIRLLRGPGGTTLTNITPRLIITNEVVSVTPNSAAAGTIIEISYTNFFGMYMNYYRPYERWLSDEGALGFE